MEIELNTGNTGNVGKPDPAQPAGRADNAKPASPDVAPFKNTHALESKLKDVPLVRPEKLHRAKSLVSDLKYPPDEMLVGIANLLAMSIK